MIKPTRAAWPIILLAVLAGCGGPTADEITEAPEPPPEPEFTGEIKPELAGTYQQKGAKIQMVLKADGAMTSKGEVNARGRIIKIDSTGEWRVKDDLFLSKAPDAAGVVKVSSRRLKVLPNGNLELSTPMVPEPTVYEKQK